MDAYLGLRDGWFWEDDAITRPARQLSNNPIASVGQFGLSVSYFTGLRLAS